MKKPLNADEVQEELDKMTEEKYYCIFCAWRYYHMSPNNYIKEMIITTSHPFQWLANIRERFCTPISTGSKFMTYLYRIDGWKEITKEEYDLGMELGVA